MGIICKEKKTITVSGETTFNINEKKDNKDATLDDIKEGSLIRVSMNGDTVTSVTIMNVGQSEDGESKTAEN